MIIKKCWKYCINRWKPGPLVLHLRHATDKFEAEHWRVFMSRVYSSSFVQCKHFDGKHAVRVPFGQCHQTTATPTAMNCLWVLDEVLVCQQVPDISTSTVEHADTAAVISHQNVASHINTHSSRSLQSTPSSMTMPCSSFLLCADQRH